MTKSCDEYARDAKGLCAGIVERHGSRVSGSEGCSGARAELAAALGEHCTRSWREALRISPDSLFAIGKIFAIGYLAGLAAIWIGGKPAYAVGLGAMVIGLAYFTAQFIFYFDVFDGLFTKVRGENLIGVVEPRDVARRQVVFVAHHDSSPIYPFYEWLPSLFPLRLLLAVAFYLACVVILILGLGPAQSAATAPATKLALLVGGFGFALPMYGYISGRGAPGAGDNLIGCAICLKLAESFSAAHGGGDGSGEALAGTRLIFLLTDGEEVGQKGAKSYIKRNRELLAGLETTVINIDSIYEYEDIAILDRDRNGFTKLSDRLAGELLAAARSVGHSWCRVSIPFLGGGTDGGQFARAGLTTASIIGLPIGIDRKEIIMHTKRDLPDRISEKAVKAVIETAREYLKRTDAKSG